MVVTAVLVELAGRGRLGRNRIVGIRTRGTMKSDVAWSTGHRAASKTVWIGFTASAVAGAIAILADDPLALACGVAVVVAFFATVSAALLRATRASAAVADSSTGTRHPMPRTTGGRGASAQR